MKTVAIFITAAVVTAFLPLTAQAERGTVVIHAKRTEDGSYVLYPRTLVISQNENGHEQVSMVIESRTADDKMDDRRRLFVAGCSAGAGQTALADSTGGSPNLRDTYEWVVEGKSMMDGIARAICNETRLKHLGENARKPAKTGAIPSTDPDAWWKNAPLAYPTR